MFAKVFQSSASSVPSAITAIQRFKNYLGHPAHLEKSAALSLEGSVMHFTTKITIGYLA